MRAHGVTSAMIKRRKQPVRWSVMQIAIDDFFEFSNCLIEVGGRIDFSEGDSIASVVWLHIEDAAIRIDGRGPRGIA